MRTILGVSGSLRRGSFNTALLREMAGQLPAGVRLDIHEGLGDLPIFNPDVDEAGAPPSVQAWREHLRQADALLVFTPEYAHGVPGGLKNALDWVVGSGEVVDKPTALLSASTSQDGGSKSHAALLQTLRVMSAQLRDDALLCIPAVKTKFDGDGRLVDNATRALLRGVLDSVVAQLNSVNRP